MGRQVHHPPRAAMISPEEIPFPLEPMSGRPSIRRRLAAILGADIHAYSSLMAVNEEETHRRVNATMDRLLRAIGKSHGRVISHSGDGLMAEFPSAVEAFKCALRVQADNGKRNGNLPPDQRIQFRIGINSGEIVLQQGRAGGNAVNVAARLEQIADPGGIFISSTVFEQVAGVVTVEYEPAGERRLKNIPQPVQVYRISAETCLAGAAAPATSPALSRPARRCGEDYRPLLAVLPFRRLQADASDAFFAEAMVDDIIRLLGGLKHLFVVARSSIADIAPSPLDLRRIGNELGVSYVLHGSVRRAAGRFRVGTELIEVGSGRVIWADRLDGDEADQLDLQDRIASRVASSVAPLVHEQELAHGRRKHPASMTAYDLTLQALDQLYRMDRESFFRSGLLLRQARAHGPDYAAAHSLTAYWHITCVGQGWSHDVATDTEAAARAAKAAVERDRNDALGLAVYGHTQSYLLKNYTTAMELFERALAAGPNSAWAHSLSGLTYGWTGDHATSLARAEEAVRLSRLGPDAYFHENVLAQAHYLSGRYDEAISWGRMSASHCEAQTSTLRSLTASLVAGGKVEEARHVARHLLQLEPEFTVATFHARTPLSGDGRRHFAERLLAAGLPG
jgi:class 3 adenylate cyclase/TolB-like protein